MDTIRKSFIRSVEQGAEEKLPPTIAERLWEDYEADAYSDFAGAVDAAVTRASDMLAGWKMRDKGSRSGDRRRGRDGTDSKANRTDLLLARQHALEESLAIFAGQREDVQRFRATHLPSGLLAPEEVAGWIEAQAEADGKATLWLQDVPVPKGHEVRHRTPEGTHVPFHTSPPLTLSSENGALRMQAKVFKYLLPSGSGAKAVAYKGVLWQLSEISELLAEHFIWTAGAAATFVLTGAVPMVSMIRANVTIRGPFHALSRISLEIDPVVNHHELAEFYRSVRAARSQGRRWRLQQPKALRLAVFMASRPDEESWEDRRRDWNELARTEYADQGDDWTYDSESTARFGHDCREAQRLLLMPDYIL